nr:MAG TPA: hypothetical protein [Caudoviricetes sp.]
MFKRVNKETQGLSGELSSSRKIILEIIVVS